VLPRALEDSVRPRLQSGSSVRPLNFTVRCQHAHHSGIHTHLCVDDELSADLIRSGSYVGV
jgi:hypothetical protein